MKNLAIFAFALIGSAAQANPFDNFIGEYSISGSPKIEKYGSARECIRFTFESLKGFSVIADTNGYRQTHMLHFNIDSPSIGKGWMGHPVMEYDYKNEFGIGGSYAKTSGDSNFAQNEFTSWDVHSSAPLVVSIQRDGGNYRLRMKESQVDNGQLKAACSYEATLIKN